MITNETMKHLSDAMDRDETCSFCKFSIANPHLYWTLFCARTEVPTLMNSDYGTCTRFTPKEPDMPWRNHDTVGNNCHHSRADNRSVQHISNLEGR